jgi:hypothetical protein
MLKGSGTILIERTQLSLQKKITSTALAQIWWQGV